MSALRANQETIRSDLRETEPARPEAAPPLSVRILPSLALEEHAAAIGSLAQRALARNVFYEAPFLIHAAHHLRDDGRPQIVSIWKGEGGDDLVGLFPIVAPRFSFVAGKAQGWLSHFMADGTPLIDMERAEDVLSAFLDWLAASERPMVGALFPAIDADGPFAALLRATAARRGLATAALDERLRAILRVGEEPSARHSGRKELRRLGRRLGERGHLQLRAATSRAEVRNAFEHFLALEARGWKGRAGTALMQDAAGAAFSRSAVRALAGEGRCRIDLLELNGAPIAATIELSAGDKASFWKTVYDENYARFSPGAQMAAQLSERHAEERDVALVDSCAESDHPMIDHLWSDRLRVVDMFIAASTDHGAAAETLLRRETIRRRVRTVAKQVYRVVRPLKRAS
ncbi:GNAT family N-acetyltransferase [Terrarubrum flagellatum]|uniref:GNAT family N-acetyltransferase n=1 Tax=Terrirubrum flagellatum TaxID=2895980 RepID=UPI0031452346